MEKERHTSLGSRESPKQEEPKEAHSKTIIIKIQKVKDKKKIFKVAGEKQIVSHKGAPIRLSTDFSTETLPARRTYDQDYPTQPRLSFRIEGERKLPRKEKPEVVHHHQTGITRNV